MHTLNHRPTVCHSLLCYVHSRGCYFTGIAGMRHVITFPIQATHAVLVLQDSSTVLLLKEVVSETSWLLGAESSFTIGGVKWTWKHSGTRRSLIAPGPIAHSVIVMVRIIILADHSLLHWLEMQHT